MAKMICIFLVMLLITACNDSDVPQKVEHEQVLKQQTEMLNKAKGVEQLLNDAAIEQQRLIDQQIQ